MNAKDSSCEESFLLMNDQFPHAKKALLAKSLFLSACSLPGKYFHHFKALIQMYVS
ncbi:hypothetical protein B4133_2601 [Bacillus altitudinis]|nr:hypothetical protein B4133_2601 [Bacillus altitudinis]